MGNLVVDLVKQSDLIRRVGDAKLVLKDKLRDRRESFRANALVQNNLEQKTFQDKLGCPPINQCG
jgi:hypothetical protein